jgi:hypothetical protein
LTTTPSNTTTPTTTTNQLHDSYDDTNTDSTPPGTAGCWIRNLFEEGIEHQPGPNSGPGPSSGYIPHLDAPITPGCTYKGFTVRTTLIQRDTQSEAWNVHLGASSYHHRFFHISPHVVSFTNALQVMDEEVEAAHQSAITTGDLIIGLTGSKTQTSLRQLNTCVVDETLLETLTPDSPLCLRLFFVRPTGNPTTTVEQATQTGLTRSLELVTVPNTLFEHFPGDRPTHPGLGEHVVLAIPPLLSSKTELGTTTETPGTSCRSTHRCQGRDDLHSRRTA